MKYGKLVPAAVIMALTAVTCSTVGHAASLVKLMTTSGCVCCERWADRMREAGFRVEIERLGMSELVQAKLKAGVPIQLSACHTAKVGKYVIEGHVPPADVARLLADQTDAAGLIVKGMPIGSPGMESGNRQEAYDVLLLQTDGTWEIYTSYLAKP